MATQSERIAVLENENKHTHKELAEIKSTVDGMDKFLRNGFTDKITKVVQEEIAKCVKPKQEEIEEEVRPEKKNIASKIWQNENFWKMANRGMVITLFMIFMIVCALLGIDITSQKSIILKLLGIG